MSTEMLEFLWYLVFLVVMTGYSVLDGFDLGVGALHLLGRDDYHRRIFLNAIGPVWDGNEVWLVILGGGLFAGFPFAYATLMSGFYIPVMALLFFLIFRAVAIEFRSKVGSPVWRQAWDVAFSVSSIGIALGLGLFLGNLATGIPLDATHEYRAGFWHLINVYTVIMAVTVLALFMMHGAIYLVMKTEGKIHDQMRTWIRPTMAFFIIMYAIANSATLIYVPHLIVRFQEHPWLFLLPVATMLAIANIPRAIHHGKDGQAFISSCASIALMIVLYAVGSFPYLVRASNDPSLSLTIANSYASAKTLQILLIIVLIGVPVALAYIISIYYIFRGKVRLDSSSY